jgi:hypothetical protein
MLKKAVLGCRWDGISGAISFLDSLKNPPFLIRGLAAAKKKKERARRERKNQTGYIGR